MGTGLVFKTCGKEGRPPHVRAKGKDTPPPPQSCLLKKNPDIPSPPRTHSDLPASYTRVFPLARAIL